MPAHRNDRIQNKYYVVPYVRASYPMIDTTFQQSCYPNFNTLAENIV